MAQKPTKITREEEAELTAGEPISDGDIVYQEGAATVDRMAKNDPDSYRWVSDERWFSDGKWLASLWSAVKQAIGAGRSKSG